MRTSAITLLALVLTAATTTLSAPSASAGGGCHREGMTDSAGSEVLMTENCFETTVVRVHAGEKVTWVNQDEVAHTVTGAGLSFGGYDEVTGGDSVNYTFSKEGVFPYFCVLHPSMVGAVVVGDGAAVDAEVTTLATESGEGGSNTASVAAIAAAVGLGGAALGLVGTRVIGARKRES